MAFPFPVPLWPWPRTARHRNFLWPPRILTSAVCTVHASSDFLLPNHLPFCVRPLSRHSARPSPASGAFCSICLGGLWSVSAHRVHLPIRSLFPLLAFFISPSCLPPSSLTQRFMIFPPLTLWGSLCECLGVTSGTPSSARSLRRPIKPLPLGVRPRSPFPPALGTVVSAVPHPRAFQVQQHNVSTMPPAPRAPRPLWRLSPRPPREELLSVLGWVH